VALLIAGSILLRPHLPRAVPRVLDELPAVCGRIAVAWLALGTLTAAYAPDRALSARTLLLGFALQTAASCVAAARCTEVAARHCCRPRTALVIGPATTAQRVAAAVLRHPKCGIEPIGIVAEHPDGTEGLPVLTTGEEVERALIQNGVRAVLTVHPSVRSERGPLLRALAESGCVVWEVDADSPSYEMRDQLAGFACRGWSWGRGRPGSFGKRALDVLASGTLLLLVSPLLLVCAVVLRLTDGPGSSSSRSASARTGAPSPC
jgi:hypothetical protein